MVSTRAPCRQPWAEFFTLCKYCSAVCWHAPQSLRCVHQLRQAVCQQSYQHKKHCLGAFFAVFSQNCKTQSSKEQPTCAYVRPSICFSKPFRLANPPASPTYNPPPPPPITPPPPRPLFAVIQGPIAPPSHPTPKSCAKRRRSTAWGHKFRILAASYFFHICIKEGCPFLFLLEVPQQHCLPHGHASP